MTILALLSRVTTWVWQLGSTLRTLASTTRSHAAELAASASASMSASASVSASASASAPRHA